MMKTFEFTKEQSLLIDEMNKDLEKMTLIRKRISLVHSKLIDNLHVHEGDIVEVTYIDPKTKKEFTDIFVAGWISVYAKTKAVSGLFYPLNKSGRPSKKLKSLEGIISIKVIQKGGQNGNS
jgi:hypothetical protein